MPVTTRAAASRSQAAGNVTDSADHGASDATSTNKPSGKCPSKRNCKQGKPQQTTTSENESTPPVISHPDHEDKNLKEKTEE